MQLLKSEPGGASLQLRALAMVAGASDVGLGQPQRAMLDAAQRFVFDTDLDPATLAPVTPEELASALTEPARARQLVRLMVATSLADGPPNLEQMSRISSFATALGVTEPAVSVVRRLAKGRRIQFFLTFARHSHVRTYFRNSYRILGGVLPVIKAILRFRGVIGEDPEMAARFHAFERLPPETLGHQFFRHCKEEGLAFPGEKGALPIGAAFHDFAHLLGGYDTSPEGEMKNAAFQAGFTQDDDDFFTMLFAIVIHSAGVNLTPFPMTPILGRIGEGEVAQGVFRGWQRGAAMKVDLGSDWNFWDDVERPIDAVRERLGVPPLPN